MASHNLLVIKKHGNQTYYVVGEELEARITEREVSNPPTSGANPPTSDSNIPTSGANIPTSGANIPTPDSNIPTSEVLPAELAERIGRIGKRTRNRELLLDIVVELCKIAPRSISELANIIHRSEGYVKHHLVVPLREQGKLAYTIPDMINHPNQKYKVVDDQDKK